MKPNPLEDLLSAYSKQPLAPASEPTTAAIWREIESRQKRAFWSRLLPALEWRELFSEPRLAVPAFALAVIVGILPGVFFVGRSVNEAQLAKRSLHFEVFSATATDIFSNRQPSAKL